VFFFPRASLFIFFIFIHQMNMVAQRKRKTNAVWHVLHITVTVTVTIKGCIRIAHKNIPALRGQWGMAGSPLPPPPVEG